MVGSIGAKIKELRRKLGICQEDICCEILSQSVLSKIENNKMLPSIPQLAHIADCLDMPVKCFFDENILPDGSPDIPRQDVPALRQLYVQRRYMDILELYEIHKLNAVNDINRNFYIGMSYYNCQLYNDSFRILKKYLTDYRSLDDITKCRLAENYATALNKLHLIMLKNSNYSGAVKYLQQAKNELVKYEKTNIKIHHVVINNLGSAYCNTCEFGKAIKELGDFINSNTETVYLSVLPSIHLSLSIAYFRVHDYEEALTHIKKAIWFFEYRGSEFDAGECYLNYINCLRFQLKFDEALKMISRLKKEHSDNKELLNLYSIQEMIVLFNMKKYDDLALLGSEITVRKLRKRSKNEYYFMLGHVEFIRNNYSIAYSHLTGCVKYMMSEKFYPDLSLVYQDLASITGKAEYSNESAKYRHADGIYNILLRRA